MTPDEMPPLSEGVLLSGDVHITVKMAEAISDYMADLMALMKMPAWKVFVSSEPSEDHCLASIEPVKNRYIASLQVCEGWTSLDRETQCMTLTHETLHLLHYRLDFLVLEDITPHFSYSEHSIVRTQYRRETEYLVEHLATFMAGTHGLNQAWDKFLRKHRVYPRQ